ncbi:MAG: ABC transporter permease [Chloroflexi bacterium]|jgi:peptide/nickel transport system permease protein|nr:ABC transporter permease [Chloroflexota bacterium]
MLSFIARRLMIMVPLLIMLSIVSFIVIQLPPGDYLSTYIRALEAGGQQVREEEIARLRSQYGLDQPVYVQYTKWITGVLHGDFGRSFHWQKPVIEVVMERLPMTLFISFASLLVVYAISIPIAILSAVYQYSMFDYVATFFGFIGLAIPAFLLALVASWISYRVSGQMVTSLFSMEYREAAWSWAKARDLLGHVWLPILVVGMAGTAGLIRTLRATLLDELRRAYVTTARSKGLSEARLLFKYPVRIAMNPVFSTIGWILPGLINGGVLVGIVLNLQMIGPVLMQATLSQDMYLTGSIVLILSTLTVVGTLISDILLAWLDPRIRYGAGE